jgi:type VI secretion system protein ImpG
MDPRLLRYYNQELQHVRDMGAEFAREFPKIAGRLGVEGMECADPYVERLLEGFAFLAARVQLKIDAEFPRFTQHLLEMVYPRYLAPTPSMAVVQLQPDLREAALATGVTVPRDAPLHSMVGRDTTVACEFRLANAVTLWPIEFVEAKILDGAAALGAIGVRPGVGIRSALRLTFRCTAGVQVRQLAMDELPLYLVGADNLPAELYAQMLGSGTQLLIRGAAAAGAASAVSAVALGREGIQRMGYRDDEALIPPARRQFSGYRLLQEYFAFSQRFLFVRLCGLRRGLQQIAGERFELIVLFDQGAPNLEPTVGADNFRLFCGAAINLFPRRADRIHIEPGVPEYHVVIDRTRPMDFEVYDVLDVEGFGDRTEPDRQFRPFYACNEQSWHSRESAYFSLRREARRLSSRQRLSGPRASYIGSEVFLSLVDPDEAPFSSNLRQLGATTLCTNRDLPLAIPISKTATDFTLESAAPVESVRCVAGLSRPRPSFAHGDASWRLISHLSLNYLSIVDSPGEGAAALREMLGLYADPHDTVAQRQIEGVRAIASKAIIGRVPLAGPIAYGRGTEIMLTLEDAAFQGSHPFMLASVLEEFFARFASINSFSKTVLRSVERGEVARWPMRLGNRPTL